MSLVQGSARLIIIRILLFPTINIFISVSQHVYSAGFLVVSLSVEKQVLAPTCAGLDIKKFYLVLIKYISI